MTARFLNTRGMVDTGALVDTAVAQRAGTLAFIGKNEAWSFQKNTVLTCFWAN